MKSVKDIVTKDFDAVLQSWVDGVISSDIGLQMLSDEEVFIQSKKILNQIKQCLQNSDDFENISIDELKDVVANIAVEWTKLDIKPNQISNYLMLLSKVVAKKVKEEFVKSKDKEFMVDELVDFNVFISSLSIHSHEILNEKQSLLIKKQIENIRRTEIPILRLDKDTILIPISGIIDSEKAMTLMKKTLNAIKNLEIHKVILDIEGVSLIDTDVANQLVRLENATKLMGAKMIISGFSPDVAETMVHLGIELNIPTTSILQFAIEAFNGKEK
ncbi:STAS domain-containing protein [Sulfurospirillum sp. 1307]